MKKQNIFIGDTKLKAHEHQVRGEFVYLDGERYYKISDYDMMPPFFISIVSASDQWMFISSKGSLTAGRKNSKGALFPYYPEDRIHDSLDITGSRTIILVRRGKNSCLWEPFSASYPHVYSIRRNIYKNLYGNKLIFQEINDDLSLSFQYGWFNSDQFGFVKNAKLINTDTATVDIDILDGIRNILPHGVDPALQSGSSNLLDAYKRSELIPETGLGIFRLSSIPVDTAEPSEALKVTTVWSEGLVYKGILLSSLQLDRFRTGTGIETEYDIKATKGAYYINAQFDLSGNEVKEWNILAEVNQDAADVAALINILSKNSKLQQRLHNEINISTENLLKIIAASDAIQLSRDELSSSRHLSNVLCNVMRGGLFEDNYIIQADEFLSHISKANKKLEEKAGRMLKSSGNIIHYGELLEKAWAMDDPVLIRLCYEYLPVSFSRRHGDPSRPWNVFSIETKNADGSINYSYQGNWRDIFQNWEALALSFPEYVESMICKFVNASTADGYNPYRITQDGIDWEKPDPSDPWSNIGYWGDHQIIYLLKLLEISVRHHPDRLKDFLVSEIFSYANVPYRIKSYRDLVKDPHNTIEFDLELDRIIDERIISTGSDGKLVRGKEGDLIHVNLSEKLLIAILSKISNFIPGAGIWMNTQRPEWNDANNALVGYGVSMVTVFYLRRYIAFCIDLFSSANPESVMLSEELAGFFDAISGILSVHENLHGHQPSGQDKRKMMDALGTAGSDYRQHIYDTGFSGRKKRRSLPDILDFFEKSLIHLDRTIQANRRSDGLFHSYNLIKFEDENNLDIRQLYEMLEGQVAVISSGLLSSGEVLKVLDALRSSELFREDQYTYILYPDRRLPLFVEKNHIPASMLERSELLKILAGQGNRKIVTEDVNGEYHFNGNFRNGQILKNALNDLPDEYKELSKKETQIILDIYEELFDHQSFTGRSGTFYGFEGLGSIYWHMVSKLLLAVCESYYRAYDENEDANILERLADHYYEVRKGLGLNKSPDVYGAFPTDPYSHTPGNRGAQQPGLTGQVKEDVIARWGELGLVVKDGKLSFHPVLLRKEELLTDPGIFTYYDIEGEKREIPLEQDSLAFTYCQIPIVYRRSKERKIELQLAGGKKYGIAGVRIDAEHSRMIFARQGKILRIDVWLEPEL